MGTRNAYQIRQAGRGPVQVKCLLCDVETGYLSKRKEPDEWMDKHSAECPERNQEGDNEGT